MSVRKVYKASIAEKLIESRVRYLQKVIEIAKSFDMESPNNREDFSAIVKAALLTGLPVEDITNEITVTASAVKRWGKGKTLPPHKTVRKAVIEDIRMLLEEMLEKEFS